MDRLTCCSAGYWLLFHTPPYYGIVLYGMYGIYINMYLPYIPYPIYIHTIMKWTESATTTIGRRCETHTVFGCNVSDVRGVLRLVFSFFHISPTARRTMISRLLNPLLCCGTVQPYRTIPFHTPSSIKLCRTGHGDLTFT